MTGTGQVSLTVNTTPAHPLSSCERAARMAGCRRRRESRLRLSACLTAAQRARQGNVRPDSHGDPLHGHWMRRHGEDRSGHAKGHLHGRGHRYGRQRVIAVPDQRECSHHDPVGRSTAREEIRRRACRRESFVLRHDCKNPLRCWRILSAAIGLGQRGRKHLRHREGPIGACGPQRGCDRSRDKYRALATRRIPTARGITPSPFCRLAIMN